MRKFCGRSKQVAPTDTRRPVVGETGTGKEVIAHAICEMSGDAITPFVKVNCAAYPAGLLESELFRLRKRCFHGSPLPEDRQTRNSPTTHFVLDEVGDIPLELQPSSYACSRSRN